MQRNLILALIGVIFIIVFALQNSHDIVVKLWFWDFENPVSIVITVFFFLGALVGILFSTPKIHRLNKKIELLEEEKEYQKVDPEKE